MRAKFRVSLFAKIIWLFVGGILHKPYQTCFLLRRDKSKTALLIYLFQGVFVYMSNSSRRQVLSWFPLAIMAVRASTLAAGTPTPVRVTPLPLVQPASFPATPIPGAVQPLAPGALAAPTLPQILIPGLPELHRCEYASNGFLEAAHAVLLIPAAELKPSLAASLARTAVQRAFAARPLCCACRRTSVSSP